MPESTLGSGSGSSTSPSGLSMSPPPNTSKLSLCPGTCCKARTALHLPLLLPSAAEPAPSAVRCLLDLARLCFDGGRGTTCSCSSSRGFSCSAVLLPAACQLPLLLSSPAGRLQMLMSPEACPVAKSPLLLL
eukprot:GHUV01036044.1.p1 GENE.GHUV01036044.1~~GHUV01036044.1.p1  ORF type:complete len:132 (-),score=28.14 GHUV01036044.1:397-792(-)